MPDSKHPDVEIPSSPSLEGLPSALERLGASPFPKSGFPLLGFLATLYDQVAAEAGRLSKADDDVDNPPEADGKIGD